mmetsp:Transcript_46730/g.117686  ORF Transcript_46730/g.117686 Transcript_46730/m.117686 type:complete len:271 (+) Transcript_46730:71-883(+)
MDASLEWMMLHTCIGVFCGISVIGIGVVLMSPMLQCLAEKPGGIIPQVDKLCPVVKAMDCSEDGDLSTCPICLSEWSPDDDLRRLPCSHTFHAECIDSWLVKAGTCALCRSCPLSACGKAASSPQATVHGAREDSLSSNVGSEVTMEAGSVDAEPGHDGSPERAPATSNTFRVHEPVSGAVELGFGGQQEAGEPAGQGGTGEHAGFIELLDSAQQQLTPIYIPGVQDYFLGLQPCNQPCETSGHNEDLYDPAQLVGYTPLRADLRCTASL